MCLWVIIAVGPEPGSNTLLVQCSCTPFQKIQKSNLVLIFEFLGHYTVSVELLRRSWLQAKGINANTHTIRQLHENTVLLCLASYSSQ